MRYAVPGTLFLVPLALLGILDPHLPGAGTGDIGLIAAGALIPVGYLVHQLWFALFEARGGYVTIHRPNLEFLVRDHRGAAEASPAEIRHAYYAWEDWVYGDDVPKGHLQRARRLWQLYHGLSSSSLATLLAVPQTLLLLGYLLPANTAALGAVLLLMALAFAVRARTIRSEANEWELMMAVEDAGPDGPHRLRARVERFIQLEQEMGRPMRAWRPDPEVPQSESRSSPASRS